MMKVWLIVLWLGLWPSNTVFPADSQRVQDRPLAGLPSEPCSHIEKIRSLTDNSWLNLGVPAADAKWGKARGRSWGSVMPYAPELKGAFLVGEGIHGWHNKETNRYMDDLWAYDVNAHRWICVHPGTDVKNVGLKMSADGFEVDRDGQPIPVAQMGHGFAMVSYDTDRRKLMFMPCPTSNFEPLFGERRKSWGGHHRYPYCPINCSPWMYNTSAGRFEISKVTGAFPGPGNGSRIGVVIYLPSIKKLFFWTGGTNDIWLYDPKDNVWNNVKPKGPKPPFGIDANVCFDAKRNRIYLGGGYYPVVGQGKNALWCYDVESNAWIDLKPAGKPCLGCNRYGPNNALLHYDSVSDVVLLFYHRLPQAPTDGDFNPGAKALGVYVYDPAANSWSETPLPMAKEIGQCPNGFYCPELNAHFIHCASDSADNGVMSVYRYRKAKGP